MAMTGAIVLITNVLFGSSVLTVITGLGTVCAFAGLWYVLPLRRRLSLTGRARP